MNELGKTLKQLRGKRSLRDIADKTGLSHTYIADIENGYRRGSKKPIHPTPETLKKLSKALDASYGELMVLAGYWDKSDASNDLTEVYNEETILENKILRILKHIVNDDNLFPSKYHIKIFEIFGGYAYSNDQHKWSSFNSRNGFDQWYLYDYLRQDPEDLTESEEQTATNEFNIYYNYNTVKQGLLSLDRILNLQKNLDDFYSDLVSFCNLNDIDIQDILQNEESPISKPEKELFDKAIELSDKEIKKQFEFTVDGRELTEEEYLRMIAAVRAERLYRDQK